jgi:hypothetical protein
MLADGWTKRTKKKERDEGKSDIHNGKMKREQHREKGRYTERDRDTDILTGRKTAREMKISIWKKRKTHRHIYRGRDRHRDKQKEIDKPLEKDIKR